MMFQCGRVKIFHPMCIFFFSLRLVKFLGGLPYTWTRYDDVEAQLSQSSSSSAFARVHKKQRDTSLKIVQSLPSDRPFQPPQLLKKNRCLTVWSSGFVLVIGFVGIAHIPVLHIVGLNRTGTETEKTAKISSDIFSMATAVGILFCFFVNSSQLAEMVSLFIEMVEQVDFSSLKVKQGIKLLSLVLLLYCTAIIANVVLDFVGVSFAMSKMVEDLSEHQVWVLWLRWAFCLSAAILHSVSAAITLLFHAISVVLSIGYASALKRIRHISPARHQEPVVIARDEEDNLEDVVRLINQFQQFQRIFNGYFSAPVTVLILKDIVAITFVIFHVGVMGQLLSRQGLMLASKFVQGVSCLVLLCCLPDQVTEQVSTFRYICWLYSGIVGLDSVCRRDKC